MMKAYIEQHRERFFDELFSLLRIPSVSSSSAHKADMYKCAERLVELLREAGADEAGVQRDILLYLEAERRGMIVLQFLFTATMTCSLSIR